MNTKNLALTTYYLYSLIITLIPLPWWYYNVGGIFIIYDSPFQISVILLGENLILGYILNIIFNAIRIYVAVNLGYSLLLLLLRKGVTKYTTMVWLPVFYLIDPVVVYLVIKYLVPAVTGISFNYPFFVIGSEIINTNYQGYNISLLIQSYPTILYWFTLVCTILYVVYLLLKK